MILTISCSTNDKKEISLLDTLKPSRNTLIVNNDNQVNIISNEGLKFNYKILDTVYSEGLIFLGLECKLENTTKNNFIYLENDCDDIQMFLKIIPDYLAVIPTRICSHSRTTISKVKAYDSIIFTTNLMTNKGNSVNIENIGIDLRVVDRYISKDSIAKYRDYFDELSFKKMSDKNIIWSK